MGMVDDLLEAMTVEAARHEQRITGHGTVTSASPLRVRLSGDDDPVPVGRLAGYTPVEDDKVGLLRIGTRWFVIDRLLAVQASATLTDFSDNTVDEQPFDWSVRWATGNQTWAVRSGPVLEHTATSDAFRLLVWDAPEFVTDQVEVETKFRTSTTDGSQGICGLAPSSGFDGYWLGHTGTLLRIRRVDNGSTTILTDASHSLSTNTWYRVRFRREGADLKARIWADGDSEPATWLLDTTDSTHAVTKAGVGAFTAAGTREWDTFEVVDLG